MLDYRKNCFNLVRLLAAIQVFIVHSITYFDIDYQLKVLGAFSGVPVFFCLSGFLIWSSIERTPDFKTYFKKRILRVYPELWMGVALSLILIIVLYSEHINWKELGLYAVTQSTFMQFWTPSSLKGYGCGAPNGSLWTMCVIIQFYFVAWFLHKFLKRKGVWLILIIASVGLNAAAPHIKGLFPSETLYKLFEQTVFPYLWLFLIGGFLWTYREQAIVYLKKFWWIAGVLLCALEISELPGIGIYDIPRCILLCLMIIGLAYSFPQLNIKADISYGIYIYHMILINVLIELNIAKTWASLLAVFCLTVLTAILSYLINAKINKRLRCK